MAELFERLFSMRLTTAASDPADSAETGLPGEPKPPQEIAHLVSQVTVTRPPTYFS